MRLFGRMLTGLVVIMAGTATADELQPKMWLKYAGAGDYAKQIVLIAGDEEYRSEEALPQLAKILSVRHGFRTTVLFPQDHERPGVVNANYGANIPGLKALQDADLMIIQTRFRALPDDQMQWIDTYLKAGKPVIGIRTATHAFNIRADAEDTAWQHYSWRYKGDADGNWQGGFGRLVLGETWIAHHGHHKHQSTRGIAAPGAEDHVILNGITDGDVWGPTDVYRVRLPLPGDTLPIVLGEVMNRAGDYDPDDLHFGMRPTDSERAIVNGDGEPANDPVMPIAWTRTYQLPGGKPGHAFTSTIGASSDLVQEGTRRLLINAAYWALGLPVPEKSDVTLVGEFSPTAYGFKTDQYWVDRNLKVSDLE